MLPPTVGRYRVDGRVGEGGMGTVYRAYDTELRRPVALKALRPTERLDDTQGRAQVRREAQALSRLNHPRICQVYDVVESPEGDLLVTEWVEGRSLGELLAERDALTVGATLGILEAVAEALAVAHERGVIHRDLKPSNVMLTAAGEVKVLDFGLARIERRSSDEQTLETLASPPERLPSAGEGCLPEGRSVRPGAGERSVREPGGSTGEAEGGADQPTQLARPRGPAGTPGFLPPEAFRGDRGSPRADVFALGVLAFALFTGRLPWRTHGAASLLAEGREELPLPLARVEPTLAKRHPKLSRLLDSMLAADPAARPTAAAVAAHARALALAPLRRRRATWAALALLATAGVGAGLASWARPVVRGLTSERPAGLVVLPVHNLTGDAVFDAPARTAFPELVAGLLATERKVAPIPGATVARVLGELAPGSEAERRTRLLRAVGARLSVESSLLRDDDQLLVVWRLRDAAGDVLRDGKLVVAIEPHPLQRLAVGLAGELAAAFDPLAARGKEASALALDDTALKAYAGALEAHRGGRPDEAWELASAAAVAAPSFPPAPQLAGVVANERGERALARAHYGWALGAARAIGDGLTEVEALRQLADLAGRGGDGEEEDRWLELARRRAETAGDLFSASRVAESLARRDYRRGDFEAAVRATDAGLAQARALAQPDLILRLLNIRALALASLRRFAPAREVAAEAEALAEQSQNRQLQAYIASTAAVIAGEAGDLVASRDAFERSVALFEQLAVPGSVAMHRGNLALIAHRLGDYQAAARDARTAMALAESLRQAPSFELAAMVLANAALELGDLPAADEAFRALVASAERSRSFANEVAGRLGLATLRERRGDATGARREREAVLAAVRASSEPQPASLAAAVALAGSLLAREPPALGAAQSLLGEAAATGEEAVQVGLTRAELLRRQGDLVAARAVLVATREEASRLEPGRLAAIDATLATIDVRPGPPPR